MKNTAKEQMGISHDLKHTHGSSEECRLYQYTSLIDGESEFVIEKTIRERFKITDYDKVIDLYDRLTCGGGRQVFELENLAKQ